MNHITRCSPRLLCLITLLLTASTALYSQDSNGVYVDKQGVLRWQQNNKEANFFGVNYTVPFAYGYRSSS